MVVHKLKKNRFITRKLAIENSECWKNDYISVGKIHLEVETDPTDMTQPADSFHTCTAKGSKRFPWQIKIFGINFKNTQSTPCNYQYDCMNTKQNRFITWKLAIENPETWQNDYISVGTFGGTERPNRYDTAKRQFHTCTAIKSKRVPWQMKFWHKFQEYTINIMQFSTWLYTN
jgi:hypothetical protein